MDYGPSKYTGWSIQDYLTPVAENYVRGVDVASFQGTSINWSQTLNTGIEFAFVKGTEGTSYVNPDLSSQAGGAHAAGLATGVYDFGHPDVNASTAGAVAEADYFINNAGQYTGPGYLPPVLDLEVGSSLGKTILTNWVVAWANEVQARTGVKPIIYVNTNYASNYLNSNVSAYTLWVANYTYSLDSQPGTGVWPGYTFWQYAGGPSGGTYDQTSIIPGINALNSDGSRNGPAVDGDVFAGTLAQLQAMVVHSYTNTADWHLDGNGNDASGNANPLTTVNGPAFTSGAFGQSLDTNSVNQYATSALPVVNTSLPYTVSAWVNWSGLGGYQAAASQDGNNASAFFLGKRDDNHFAFIVNSSDTNAPGQTTVAWGTAPVQAPGTISWVSTPARRSSFT